MASSPWKRTVVATRAGLAASRWAAVSVVPVILTLVNGCAGVDQPVTGPQLSTEDRTFLVAPSTGYPLTLTSAEARRVDEGFSALLQDGDRQQAGSISQQLLARNPDLHPATVLAAQAAFVAGDAGRARELLTPVPEELREYTAWQLLLGRSAEQQADIVPAFEAYKNVADQNAAARAKTEELGPRVVQVLAQRVEDDLRRGRTDEAARELARMEQWLPDENLTLESAVAVGRATEDREAELEALRGLVPRRPGSQPLAERRGILELEVGDAGAGLRIFQELSAANPGDARLQEELARARFLWRLQLLPIEARDLVSRPELSRADFAAMLYWLFPEVRYGQAGQVRIANDVLDQQYREEIVRVVNLGIMDVDERLHEFSPDRAVTRAEALTSMAQLLSRRQPPLACLGGVRQNDPLAFETVCRVASSCGLLESAADCLPTVGVSGSEAVELSRLTLSLLGAAQ